MPTVIVADEILAKNLKKQKSFQDEDKNFSRGKYEKFLLENNITSIEFEQGIKNNELKRNLFNYIGGGIKAPYFLINKTYKEQLKKVEVDYFNLSSIYINEKSISILNENSLN